MPAETHLETGPVGPDDVFALIRERPAEILEIDGREVAISNPQKVYFPDAGYTKLDVVHYYLAVAEGALTGVRGRPMALKRFVDGIAKEPFFQKRAPDNTPDWIRTAELTFPSGRTADVVCPTEPAVMAWAAQIGTLTFHPWPVRRDSPDHPDGIYHMHTCYKMSERTPHPELGAVIAKFNGDPAADLPTFVRMGPCGNAGAGYLGPAHEPFGLDRSGRLPYFTSSYLTEEAEKRRADLFHAARIHHDDTVGQRHRFDLVMRDIDRGCLDAPVQLGDLEPHLHPQAGIEIGQRFVEQESLRITNDGPPHGDTLTLPARQLPRPTLQQGRQFQGFGGLPHALVDHLWILVAHAQPKPHVLGHRHMRIERVILEHHGDVAVARPHLVHHRAADLDGAAVDIL